jgi:RimJ/RimL family protein N-acetyltransferase
MEPGGSSSQAAIRARGAGRGIRRLTAPVRARILEDPGSYEQLANFMCGDEHERSAAEVHVTARRLAAGEAPLAQVPVVLEEQSGELIAFCSVHRYPQRHLVPEAYITAFGRSSAYRGCRLRDGVTTPGLAVLIAALEMIALGWEGRPMPQVWARVLRGNEPSHALFDRLGFLNLGEIIVARSSARVVREDQQVRLLPACVPLPPPLDPDVYLPPVAPRRPVLPAPPAQSVLVPGSPRTASVTAALSGIMRESVAGGRNEPCWCGSGRKLKKCHGA